MLIGRRDSMSSKIRSLGSKSQAFDESTADNNVLPFSGNRERQIASPKFGDAAKTSVSAHEGKEKLGFRKLLIGDILCSSALHVAVIEAAMPREVGEQFGTVAAQRDAISLSTIQTVVLESISSYAKPVAASAAASQAGGVPSAESKPLEVAEIKDIPLSDEPPPKPVKVADVTPATLARSDNPLPIIHGGGDADAPNEIKVDQIAEKPVVEMPDTDEKKEDVPEKAKREKELEKEKRIQQAESHAQAAGSATSRSSAAQAAVNGHVSASSGNALTYAAGIRARVERNKPSDNGLRGTVRVSFAINALGELSYVRLASSSGNVELDDAALTAVRGAAPFEKPPSDMAQTQLAFVIPFYFR